MQVWSGTCNGELLGQHLGHVDPVHCLAVDGNFLFSGSLDTTVRVWDMVPSGFGSSNSTAGQGRQPGMAGSGQGRVPATGSHFGTDVYRVANMIDVEALSGPTPGRVPRAPSECRRSHAGSECSASAKVQQGGLLGCPAVAANAKGSASCSCPHSLAFRVLLGHTASVMGLGVVMSSGLLVSAGRDGRIIQWDYINGCMLAQQHVQGEQLLCLSVQHGSGVVFAGTHGGQVLSFQLTEQVPDSDMHDDGDVARLVEPEVPLGALAS